MKEPAIHVGFLLNFIIQVVELILRAFPVNYVFSLVCTVLKYLHTWTNQGIVNEREREKTKKSPSIRKKELDEKETSAWKVLSTEIAFKLLEE